MDPYQILKDSKWVNSKWYLEEYPDVKLLGMDPIEHYLKIGARLGRNPCRRFDTKFYIKNYPDVAENGMNPLVHYVRYGRKEGRYPRPNRVDVLYHSLWAGHSKSALKELQSIYEDSTHSATDRYDAAWQVARWRAFEGNYLEAMKMAEIMGKCDPIRELSKERVLLIADCHRELGNPENGREILEQFLKRFPGDSDALFFLANTYQNDDEQRLELINRAIEPTGAVGIELIDRNRNLTFDNIRANSHQLARLQARKEPQKEKVSIIIPAYNAEDRIHVAIQSLLVQTWKNIEIIVVDDCSPDDTFNVVQSLAKQDSRVIPVKQPKNAGAYAARNAGLLRATGDFITTHDSDDWSHPQKLEKQINTFKQHENVMGVVTHWIRSIHDLRFTQNWRPGHSLIHWSHSSFMFRKQVLEDVGHWDEVRIGGDTEFIWRVEQHYGKDAVQKIHPEVPLAFALDDEGSLTRTKATHVSTVYYGLRHIYRQICAWWHRTHEKLHMDNGLQTARIFNVPKGMISKDKGEEKFDIVLVSDFSRTEISKPLYKIARALNKKGKRVALFHWPTYGEKQFKLNDEYFELIYEKQAFPVVFGDTIAAPIYVASSVELIAHELDAIPEFRNFKQGYLLGNARLTHGFHRREFDANAREVTAKVFGAGFEVVDANQLEHMLGNFL